MADPQSGKSNFISSLVKFKEILTYVERDYVDEIDAEKLVGEAINEMLEKLDPHSVYIPAKDRELTNSQLEGEFDEILFGDWRSGFYRFAHCRSACRAWRPGTHPRQFQRRIRQQLRKHRR